MKALRRSQSISSSSSVANLSPPLPLTRLSSPWVPLRALLVVSSRGSDGGNIKSSWSRRKRKHALSRHRWNKLFTDDRRLRDGGVKLLKRVRRGGVDPDIRAEVWPFLLGVYKLNSSAAERSAVRKKKRKEYIKLRLQCRQLFKYGADNFGTIDEASDGNDLESPNFIDDYVSSFSRDAYSIQNSLSYDASQCSSLVHSSISSSYTNRYALEESDGESSEEEHDALQYPSISADHDEDNQLLYSRRDSLERYSSKPSWTEQDFMTWRRIIRLDALRADAECLIKQRDVSIVEVCRHAEDVELKDYEHLEPRRIHHATRLVEILEAYAVYDPEIGYCQGMSDLLSPIIAVINDDHEAFWCFVGFMSKARHNFRLDETGIRRQLNFVSRIIKSRDLHLYRHLEKLQAEDCSFVYRMVVVLFRRELSFEQTLCLWEAMWADQAAIRAGLGRYTCGRIRLKAPPTNDLLLYAIAACILQRRKLIIDKYSSMDEIVKECNNLNGHLDVSKLLDDAHNLVISLHNKM